MGGNTIERYGAKGRKDLLLLDPEDVVLITDEKHELYDVRVHLPIHEPTVLNMMAIGCTEPITVRLNGVGKNDKPIVECVKGRQRVKNLREANRRLKALGRDTSNIKAQVNNSSDRATLLGWIIAENALRQDDDPVARAETCMRYLDLGKTEEEAANVYGVTVQTIENWKSLLNCSETVLKAVKSGDIGATLAAKELSKVPREEQPEALKKLVESGVTKGSAAREAVRQIRTNGTPPKKKGDKIKFRPKKEIWKAIKALKKLGGKHAEVAAAALNYALSSTNSFVGVDSKIEQLLCPNDGED